MNQDKNKNKRHYAPLSVCDCPHHSFVPNESHPLLHSIDTFWDLGEVILANGLLGHAEGAVSATSHTQVSTGRRRGILKVLHQDSKGCVQH